MAFPSKFVWGAATSAYQIEGGALADGAGPSIYESFCLKPGAVWGGHNGSVSCDHYHRMKEDVALMKQMGLKAYRFSIAWPRVMPEGVGRVNAAGLDFYSQLVDELKRAGIEPWVTLYHWDFPLALQHKGGWLNRESAEWFGQYAQVVVDRLSDRVHNWMTINEPQVYIKFGYGDGKIAPGLKLGMDEQLAACHNALRAHGRAAQAIRSRAKTPPYLGWAVVGRIDWPWDPTNPQDIAAAAKGTMAIVEPDLWNNTWYADPAVFGHYPEDGAKLYHDKCSAKVDIQPGDMELIKQPLDYYGVNIYEGRPVKGSPAGEVVPVKLPTGHPQTAFRWFITPPCLRWGPRLLWERYKLPIYITENGMSNIDWVSADGAVHDPQRIDYTRSYLLELEKAIADGADIRGYFHWSLLDNFEWAEGYKERFGLIHVDFATLKRTPKDSSMWYRKVIESNGEFLRA